MIAFRDKMEADQVAWRNHSGLPGGGLWSRKSYEHILLRKDQQANLWPGIQGGGRFPLDAYLRDKGIHAHTGRDNLLSSWTLCANLYFPFGQDDDGRRLAAGFLRRYIDPSIADVRAVELEYEHNDPKLKPLSLLGEMDGDRGTNQTSPDLAFVVELDGGQQGVVLTEVKFTEHNFYACSARKDLPESERNARCDSLVLLKADPQSVCAQHKDKKRLYWDHLAQDCFDWDATLRSCPAATAGYQLFRQHALAEGLARNSDFALVVSSVACDERNEGLMKSLRRTGISDVATDWGKLFKGKAKFKVFTHQDWVGWVRDQPERPSWCDDWLVYVSDRYGFGADGEQP